MKRFVLFFAIAATAVSGLFVSTPALAHDEIVATSPIAGSSVEAGIIDVSVTFNEDIMVTPDNAGEVVQVMGPDGTDSQTWSNGCSTVAGAKVSTQVDLDQPGKYTVNWRSVSNDGHANEGSFDFTLSNSSGHKSSGLLEPGPECAALVATPVAVDSKLNTPMATMETSGEGDATLPIVVVSVGVAMLLTVAFISVRRRRAGTHN